MGGCLECIPSFPAPLIMVALCNREDHYIFALLFLSIYLANLECRSEKCCTRLAANAGPKKVAVWAPSHNIIFHSI